MCRLGLAIATLLPIGLLLGCEPAPRVRGPEKTSTPIPINEDGTTIINFPPTYVGYSSEVEVQFTLHSVRIPHFEFLFQENSYPVFTVAHEADPLRLAFSPSRSGQHEAKALVRFEGRSYPVQLRGLGLETPDCGPSNGCDVNQFDPASGRCVHFERAEGAECNESAATCDSHSVCRNHVCVAEPYDDLIPLCDRGLPTQDLQAEWSFQSHYPRGDIYFSGTSESEGALYLLDCEDVTVPGSRCDIVALSANGSERWRVPGGWRLTFTSDFRPAFPQLVRIGKRLILSGVRAQGEMDAYEAQTGRLLWSVVIPGPKVTVRNGDFLASLSGTPAKFWGITMGNGGTDWAAPIVENGLPAELVSTGQAERAEVWRVGRVVPGAAALNQDPTITAVLFMANAAHEIQWKRVFRIPHQGRILGLVNGLPITDEGLVISPETGADFARIPMVNTVQDVVWTPDAFTVVRAQITRPGCTRTVFQRAKIYYDDQPWQCRFPQEIRDERRVSALFATDRNGPIVAVDTGNGESTLTAISGFGTPWLSARVPLSLARSDSFVLERPATTMLGNLWIVSGYSAQDRGRGLFAYRLPNLSAASSGWIAKDGSPSRDGAAQP
jgi:hypothetical protein